MISLIVCVTFACSSTAHGQEWQPGSGQPICGKEQSLSVEGVSGVWMPAWCANRYIKVVKAYGVLYDSVEQHKKLERILTKQVSTATAAMAGAQKSADIANENLEKALATLAEPPPLYKEPVVTYLGGIATALAVVGAVTAIIVSGGSTAQ